MISFTTNPVCVSPAYLLSACMHSWHHVVMIDRLQVLEAVYNFEAGSKICRPSVCDMHCYYVW